MMEKQQVMTTVMDETVINWTQPAPALASARNDMINSSVKHQDIVRSYICLRW